MPKQLPAYLPINFNKLHDSAELVRTDNCNSCLVITLCKLLGRSRVTTRTVIFWGTQTFQALDEHDEPIPNTMSFEVMRGGKRETASVDEFRTFLIHGRNGVKIYGGSECIAAFVNLYQVFRVRF